jgi:hypothetical protein
MTVNKSGLQLIGWVFGSATAAVMLIAALLVTDAVASNHVAPAQTTVAAR